MKVRLAKLKNLIADNVYIIAAMLAVDFIMAFVFYTYDLWPFGDITILRMDLYHQYWPLFTELYDRLTEHKSLIYSWNTGLGGPFLGNFYNYLSSPFLVYILIAGRNHIAEAISMMIVSKASLAAGTFTYYLKKSQGKHSFLSAGFGVLYAQSAWFVAFYWNVMWLDALYMLPLVVLGIERLIKDKKPLLYILSLAFTLLTNYYMGYMVCIFSVIWFLVYYFSNYRLVSDTGEHIGTLGEKRTLSEKLRGSLFINRGFTFVFSSFIAAGLVAFALVPTFVILRSSSATSGVFPTEIKSYFTFIQFICNHMAALAPTVRSKGDYILPNVYSGILTMVLIPFYFLSKKISRREKTTIGLGLLIFYFSFNTNFMNFIWHGFHFPNDMPYRMSFTYSFLLAVIASKAICEIPTVKRKILISIGLVFAVLFLSAKAVNPYEEASSVVLSSLLFFSLYLFVCFFAREKKDRKNVSALLVFTVLVIELVFCNTGCYSVSLKKDSIIKEMKMFEKIYNTSFESNSLFRMDFDDIYYYSENAIRMKPALYNYCGISVFSSMTNEKMTIAQKKLGIQNNGKNMFFYSLQTPVYNMMHNIKYIVCNRKDGNKQITYKTNNLFELTKENEYYLNLGFRVNDDCTNVKFDDNPFISQINWFKTATGIDNVFKKVEITPISDGLILLKNDYYNIEKKNIKNRVDFSVNIKSKGHLFIYAEVEGANSASIGENLIYSEYPCIIDYGNVNIGNIEFYISGLSVSSDASDVQVKLFAYMLNEDALKQGYEKLKQNQLEITSFEETNIKGTVTAKEDGVMWTSISYDKGWSVMVDGKPVETIAVQDAYLCFDMPAGEHTVEFTFTQPGLKEGICISVASLLLCVAYVVILKKKQK